MVFNLKLRPNGEVFNAVIGRLQGLKALVMLKQEIQSFLAGHQLKLT